MGAGGDPREEPHPLHPSGHVRHEFFGQAVGNSNEAKWIQVALTEEIWVRLREEWEFEPFDQSCTLKVGRGQSTERIVRRGPTRLAGQTGATE